MADMPSVSDIEQVLVHRGTMRLVERVLEYDSDNIAVEVRVPLDSPFHAGCGVPAYVGIEYMAQAVAAWAGCTARAQGQAPSLGFLLGSRRYECAVSDFASGWTLRVEAHREIVGASGLGVFSCRILKDEQELAWANISVYEPRDANAFLEETT